MLHYLFRPFAGLMVAIGLATVAPAQQFHDEFEAAEIDAFWGIADYAGADAVALSSERSHEGAQSLRLRAFAGIAGGGTVWRALPTISKGAASVWVYDSAGASSDRYCSLTLQNAQMSYGQPGSAVSVGMMDWDANRYWVMDPRDGLSDQSSVQRSRGWHHFEVIVGPDSVEYRIDGISVASYVTDFAFDHVYLEVFGPVSRPAATYYFDEFGLNARSVYAPTFVPLGYLRDATSSRAQCVSADGNVAIGTAAMGEWQEGFRWEYGQLRGIGDLPGGRTESGAVAVSGDGRVIVGASSSASSGGQHGDREAFRWEAGVMAPLGDLEGGAFLSEADAVSADGRVIAGRAYSTSNEAFRWEDGVMNGLGFLPGGTFSLAYGISADGQTVVGYADSIDGIQAFRWHGGQMGGLGDLPFGGFDSVANATTPNGAVVVGFGTSESGQEAALWRDSLVMGLGDLPGGVFESQAFSITSDGRTVVGYGSSDRGSEAILWTEAGGMMNLRDWLIERGVGNLEGWRLINAWSITADGGTVVGEGINPSGWHEAWVVYLAVPCLADVDRDAFVGLSDLATLLAHFGASSAARRSQGDLDYDGDVDLTDLARFLAEFGTSCP